ncbi:Hypoxanthine-guanine phosphoribosyltransferase [Legionella massiliensis]|uniref:Hypoxanthine-guanine phosphoribosyltransferase n=1 Tax=Legionella massiliensis TaxID=1034943 RepID=A0A078KWB4_9GAMM|nr:phosphoribosyltransferase family protein [Legionella massiliensis]CDZ75968.1 Hypoxanthine-guanine phosphoribosyltransferase [Legionella massiliensis]CEE11706.1 Hypoxanthine-guanine phosphoribosyltransferase [Legionella massiliensis]
MLSESEIRAELTKIKKLKEVIAARLWAHGTPVFDINNGKALSEENIKNRIASLAEEIIAAYPDECPLLVGVLVGGMPFANRLFDELTERGYSFDPAYMQTSSYHGGVSSGDLTVDLNTKIPPGERTVIVIDDVCDTGKTYKKIKELFEKQGAKEVHLMTLVDKKQERALGCHPTFSGFVISKEEFIIGFGLDYAEKLRNTKEIRAVDTDYLPNPEEEALLNREKQLNTQLQEIIARKQVQASAGTSRDSMFGHPASSSSLTPTLEIPQLQNPQGSTVQQSGFF